jgi:3-phenylpropionate/trans-cinnamate dioxygenase ferredoxin subunit
MTGFVEVGKVDQLPEGGSKVVEVQERLVALFRVGDTVYALDDVCTHDGGPLAEGEVDDHTVACPRHGARFSLIDGSALSMPATQATASHEVKVEDGLVYVRLADD